jgi:hypothetical protein
MVSPTFSVRRGESGQAAVEAALTLPLTIFLVLGTLQLFMMLQGRIMAEYAAFEAVRAGSRHQGDCEMMMQAGLAALLPNFNTYLGGSGGGSPGSKLAEAWRARINGGSPQYIAKDSGTPSTFGGASLAGESIFWLFREQPTNVPSPEDVDFDAPSGTGGGMRLEVRLVYWFPLRIPFADWVMTRMFMAHFGIQDYNAANPLIPAEKNAGWTSGASGNMEGQIRSKYQSLASAKKYVFPIQATYGMRMMTPAKARFFQRQNCGDTPG